MEKNNKIKSVVPDIDTDLEKAPNLEVTFTQEDLLRTKLHSHVSNIECFTLSLLSQSIGHCKSSEIRFRCNEILSQCGRLLDLVDPEPDVPKEELKQTPKTQLELSYPE